MALILSGSHSSGPSLLYELHAEQTAGTGTKRTVKLTLNLKCGGSSSSWFGYPMNWRCYVNGTWSGWSSAKGTESWRGGMAWKTFTWSYSTDVGTTASKAITVGFGTDSYSGSNSWDCQKTGNFTVGSTNSAPVMSGYLTFREDDASGAIITNEADGAENVKKVRENLGNVYISWPAAKDNEGGTITYEVYNQQNESAFSKIVETTSTSYIHNIGTGNQGRSYDYYVRARDNGGLVSGNCNGTQFQKNVMTGSTITSTDIITYDKNSIGFTWSNPSNTNGNTSFDFVITADGITINRGTITDDKARSASIAIVDTAPSTGMYILRQDLINKFKGSGHKGNLNFTLTTKNAYGSVATSVKSLAIDMRTSPNPVGAVTIDKTKSTALMTHQITKNQYYIPDQGRKIVVKWTAGSDKLGGKVTYALQAKLGNGSFITIANNLSVLEYQYELQKQTVSQNLIFRVITKTDFNYETSKDSEAIILHYYNNPFITVGNINRTDGEAIVQLTVKTNSSIPNINSKGTWSNKESGTTTNLQTGVLSITQNAQSIKLIELKAKSSYLLSVLYNDDTGFMEIDKSEEIRISENSPLLAITKEGVGIGGVNATIANNLNVKGSIGLAGDYIDPVDQKVKTYNTTIIKQYKVDKNGLAVAISPGGPLAIGGGESAQQLMDLEETDKFSEQTYITSDNNIEFYNGCQTIADKKRSVLNSHGNLHIYGGIYSGFGTGESKKCWDRADLPIPARLTKVNNSSYWGLSSSEANEDNWMRTTTSGLIPNKQNDSTTGHGGSALGTTSWRFSNVFSRKGDFSESLNVAGAIVSRDTFKFADNGTWKSLDFVRSNGSQVGTSRFGIGLNPDGPSPSIEYHQSAVVSNDYKSRVNLCATSLRLDSKGTDQSCWLGFYSAGTRYGYVGRGSRTSNDMMLFAEKGNMIIRSSYKNSSYGVCADTGGWFRPENTGDWATGHSSYRWNTVYYNNLNAPSDSRLKENIKYLNEENFSKEESITIRDYYNFIKDDLKLATYDYKNLTENKIEKEKCKNKVGFIAQDIKETKIGKTFIEEDEVINLDDSNNSQILKNGDKQLSYDLTNYVNILAAALQEAINEIEKLKTNI